MYLCIYVCLCGYLLYIFFIYVYMTQLNLVLPCRLISDLVVVIVSATIGGIAFSCLGQPVSNHIYSLKFKHDLTT